MKKVFIGRLSIEKDDALVGYMTNKWNNLGTASLATKICHSEDSVSKSCQNRGRGSAGTSNNVTCFPFDY